jgi:methyl-accepting chemotaxis protein
MAVPTIWGCRCLESAEYERDGLVSVAGAAIAGDCAAIRPDRAGAAVAIVAVAIVFVVVAAARYNEAKTRGDLEQKMMSLTAMITHASPPLILARDTVTLSYILESLKRDPDFDAGFVADDLVALATAGRNDDARLSLTPNKLSRQLGREAWS